MNSERRPGSRLPDDAAYWERLAARSVAAAFDNGGAHVVARGAPALDPPGLALAVASPWWRGLSDAAFMLAASALLALVSGAVLLDERAPGTLTEAHAFTAAIAPDDDVLASLMNADEPPPAMAMLRVVARREAER